MDNKDNKRGFSGLSGLTSGSSGSLQPNGASKPAVSPCPSSPEKPVFPLLDQVMWPTHPAAWSSADSGETWIWGDFFFTFQKRPRRFIDVLMDVEIAIAKKILEGRESLSHQGVTYHYAMSVFYRLDKNPHGPSRLPIMVVALEEVDIGMGVKMLGGDAGKLLQSEAGRKTLMVGLFSGEVRLNLGRYQGDTAPQAVKKHFFEILGSNLGLTGQPKMIGDLAQAHGHPETGLPAKKKNSGCVPMILLCIGIGGLLVWGLTLL